MEEVVGSIPTRSTKSLNSLKQDESLGHGRWCHDLCRNLPFGCSASASIATGFASIPHGCSAPAFGG
jgi:hypothetical protein